MHIFTHKAGPCCSKTALFLALLVSCLMLPELCQAKRDQVVLFRQSTPLSQKPSGDLEDDLRRRDKLMSSNALGMVVLGSTILGSTAVIRHATHMHLLPPSVRHTFDISDSEPSPVIYKITQDELKQLEEQRAEADADTDKKKQKREEESSSLELNKRAMSGKNVATFSALAGLGGYLVRA